MDFKKRAISAYKKSKDKEHNESSTPVIPPRSTKREKEVTKTVETIRTGNVNRNVPVKPQDDVKKAENGLLKTFKVNGYKKAAKFLLLLGKEQAIEVVKHLSKDEVEKITREIAAIKKVSKEEAKLLLQDFDIQKDTPPPAYTGGVDFARNLLTAAMGEEKGKDFLYKVVPEAQPKPFDFLNDLELTHLHVVLKNEPMPVLGIILPYLKAEKASKIIISLPEDQRMILIKRMARMEKVSQAVLETVETAMRDKIRKHGKVDTHSHEIDGKSALANILKHMDMQSEREIMSNLQNFNPELHKEVEEKLFTIDTILQIEDGDLEKSLRDFSENEIAMFLKGKTDEFREKILSNVSRRRLAMIEDEMIHLGAVKRSEVDEVTKEFIRYFRRLAEKGELKILDDDDPYIM